MASAGIVLGARTFAPMGAGFGTVKPKKIFNAGDPSGLVQDIAWSHWGSPTATGVATENVCRAAPRRLVKETRTVGSRRWTVPIAIGDHPLQPATEHCLPRPPRGRAARSPRAPE